jgi:hypothetical protein
LLDGIIFLEAQGHGILAGELNYTKAEPITRKLIYACLDPNQTHSNQAHCCIRLPTQDTLLGCHTVFAQPHLPHPCYLILLLSQTGTIPRTSLSFLSRLFHGLLYFDMLIHLLLPFSRQHHKIAFFPRP